jgi:hypothetical protein
MHVNCRIGGISAPLPKTLHLHYAQPILIFVSQKSQNRRERFAALTDFENAWNSQKLPVTCGLIDPVLYKTFRFKP